MTTMLPESNDVLERFEINSGYDTYDDDVLVHSDCGAVVCMLEPGDTLALLARTAHGHAKECTL